MRGTSERKGESDQVDRRSDRIGIVVVAYNAASTLAAVLDRLPQSFRSRVAEVVVCDDASSDCTYTVGKEYQAETDLPLTVIRRPQNLGYGGNQKAAYRWAIDNGLDIVVLLHGDGQYAPEVIEDLVAPFASEECDAVFGSRLMDPGSARIGGMPLYKYVGNRVLSWFAKFCYRTRTVGVAQRLSRLPRAGTGGNSFESNTDGFDFDTEIILQLLEAKKKIVEVSIPTFYGNEICHVNGMGYAKDVVKDVLRYRVHKVGFGSGEMAFSEQSQQSKRTTAAHRKLLTWLAEGRPKRILDLNCSNGKFGELLRLEGHTVVGVDKMKRDGVGDRLDEFFEADLNEGLPAEVGGDFDVVIGTSVFERLAEPEVLLAQLADVLGPRGVVMASVPNIAHWYATAVPRGRGDRAGCSVSPFGPGFPHRWRSFCPGAAAPGRPPRAAPGAPGAPAGPRSGPGIPAGRAPGPGPRPGSRRPGCPGPPPPRAAGGSRRPLPGHGPGCGPGSAGGARRPPGGPGATISALARRARSSVSGLGRPSSSRVSAQARSPSTRAILKISQRPAASCRAGRVRRKARQTTSAGGGWKAPARFLPASRSTRGLAAQPRVHLGQQGGGPGMPADAAHVQGRGQPGHVGEHAAAHRHHGGVAAQGMPGPGLQPGDEGRPGRLPASETGTHRVPGGSGSRWRARRAGPPASPTRVQGVWAGTGPAGSSSTRTRVGNPSGSSTHASSILKLFPVVFDVVVVAGFFAEPVGQQVQLDVAVGGVHDLVGHGRAEAGHLHPDPVLGQGLERDRRSPRPRSPG